MKKKIYISIYDIYIIGFFKTNFIQKIYFFEVKGFEPLILRTKNECLTTWLYFI